MDLLIPDVAMPLGDPCGAAENMAALREALSTGDYQNVDIPAALRDMAVVLAWNEVDKAVKVVRANLVNMEHHNGNNHRLGHSEPGRLSSDGAASNPRRA